MKRCVGDEEHEVVWPYAPVKNHNGAILKVGRYEGLLLFRLERAA